MPAVRRLFYWCFVIVTLLAVSTAGAFGSVIISVVYVGGGTGDDPLKDYSGGYLGVVQGDSYASSGWIRVNVGSSGDVGFSVHLGNKRVWEGHAQCDSGGHILAFIPPYHKTVSGSGGLALVSFGYYSLNAAV